MESIKSSARFVRTAPDKVRILYGLVKNKKIEDALAQLEFAGKYAAKPLILVLKQAKAQIKDRNLVEENMTIKEMRVDEGPKLKRRRIRHQGRSTAILKRLCHITIILSENPVSVPKLENKVLKKPAEKENKGSV